MALAQPNDKFLVNRNDISYSVKQEDLMAQLQDSDYMLVNRNDVTSKMSGKDVIDSFVPDLQLKEVILNTYTPITKTTLSARLDAEGGCLRIPSNING